MTPAQFDTSDEAGRPTLRLSGALTAASLSAVWKPAAEFARKAGAGLTIDLSNAAMIDTSGAAFILALERASSGAEITGASDNALKLLDTLRHSTPETLPQKPKIAGDASPGLIANLITRISFLGDTVIASLALPGRLRFLRGADFFRIAERAGIQALPLVVMLGFLIGMILAFQSAIPMRQFGADLYVANLVAISLFRELGPLLCAVILAGRTGSAFAAELGTMTVNEEVAALATMGVDPETMLVLPRMAASMMVMPALVVAIDLAGLLGMGVVLMLLGFPPAAIVAQVISTTGPSDFLLGMMKGVIFAGVIAVIGCRAGLTAGLGPRAVGEAATSAVVGGIVATVVLDGLFAVVFYRLGL